MKILFLVLFLLFFQMTPGLIRAEEEMIRSAYDEDLLQYGIQFLPPVGAQKVRKQANKELGIDAYYFLVPKKFFIAIQSPFEMTPEDFKEAMDGFRQRPGYMTEENISFLSIPTFAMTTYSEDADGMMWKNKEYHFYNKGKAYLIAFGALQTEFDDYEPEFEKALESFKIID